MCNCWNAIHAVLAGRHYIARVQGQPINTVRKCDYSESMNSLSCMILNLLGDSLIANDVIFVLMQCVQGTTIISGKAANTQVGLNADDTPH